MRPQPIAPARSRSTCIKNIDSKHTIAPVNAYLRKVKTFALKPVQSLTNYLPANSTAMVYIAGKNITESGLPAANAEGVAFLGRFSERCS